MDRLSAELVHVVCSHLETNDIYNFRLTCRAYGDVGACYSHRRLKFHFHHDDFQMLELLSRHPIISKNVVSLVYFTNRLELKSDGRKKDRVDLILDYEKRTHRLNTRETHAPPSATEELNEMFQEYEKIADRQIEMIQLDEDCRMLQGIVSRLGNLQEIEVRYRDRPRQGQAGNNMGPFKKIKRLNQRFTRSKPTGCRELRSLLSSLPGSTIMLRSLACENLDWTFFSEGLGTGLHAMPSLQNLTMVELSLNASTELAGRPDGASEPASKHLFGTGVVGRFLSSLDKLRDLRITLGCYAGRIPKPACLPDIITPGHHWSHLESLSLGGLECEGQDLLGVLGAHKETLRSLCICSIELTSRSWFELLPAIQEVLCLDTACICGELIDGLYEGLAWHGGYPDEGPSWVTGLGHAMNEYLVSGGTMPLSEHNASPRDGW
ncbi:hypothetical protein JX265_001446 [Neoarthrinium moseri]|uniref:F-box domain-containing protein n=1 Tax=Neoarthrinium moseri TaxID=1658444 RepID=A0A9P9WVH7_9PEZI|nr:hypothetical protein JX266_011601 [Neoarthrinium moseri]KAI1879825.1 hypothetical protein JX265_001446 [Neoarthrinium moseri]